MCTPPTRGWVTPDLDGKYPTLNQNWFSIYCEFICILRPWHWWPDVWQTVQQTGKDTKSIIEQSTVQWLNGYDDWTMAWTIVPMNKWKMEIWKLAVNILQPPLMVSALSAMCGSLAASWCPPYRRCSTGPCWGPPTTLHRSVASIPMGM